MAEALTSWPREHWSQGGGDALLFYVIYGEIDVSAPFDSSKYRTSGLPEGLDVRLLTRAEDDDYLKSSFEDGYPWEHLLETNPALARDVERSSSCLILQGVVADPPSLDYLRDAIGHIAFFLDHGGVGVYDIQVMKWWSPSEWQRRILEPEQPEPSSHTIILYSDEDGGTWFHTRGMRKFGRPDISVPDVPAPQFDAAVDLCNRFIAHQAFGALVPEGQAVRMAGLERAGVVRHRGDFDDDDFNNVHIEIEWEGAV